MEDHRSELLNLQSKWAAPAELLIPPPRPVELSFEGRLARGAAIIMALVMLAGGLYVASLLQRQRSVDRSLEARGDTASGQIISKRQSAGKNRTSYVRYGFEANGRAYEREVRVSNRHYPEIREGQPVQVRYDSQDPAVSRIELEVAPVIGAAAIPAAITCLLLLWAIIGSLRSQHSLLQSGRAAPAIVTGAKAAKGGQAIAFSFLDTAGSVVRGHTTVRPGQSKEQRKAGDVVPVLFHPDRLRRNFIYPPSLWRIQWGPAGGMVAPASGPETNEEEDE